MTATFDWCRSPKHSEPSRACSSPACVAYPGKRTANRLLATLMLASSIYLAANVYYAAGLVYVHPQFFGILYPLP